MAGGAAYLGAGISLVFYGWTGEPFVWLLPSGILALGIVAACVEAAFCFVSSAVDQRPCDCSSSRGATLVSRRGFPWLGTIPFTHTVL